MQSARLRAVPDAESTQFGDLLCRLRLGKAFTRTHKNGRRSGGVVQYTTTAPLSQAELARRAELDPALVSRLESGERSTMLRSTVDRLAAALELDADDTTLLVIAAGYWPWPALDERTALLVAQTALAVIAGDYRPLEDAEP